MPAATGLLQAFKGTIEHQGIGAAGDAAETLVTGVTGSQRTLLTAALFADDNMPYVVLTYSQARARQWKKDLSTLLSPHHVHVFSAYETLPHEEVVSDAGIRRDRLQGLDMMRHGVRGMMIVPIQTVIQKIMPPAMFQNATLHLRVGDTIDPARLAAKLTAIGYERTEKVETVGDFAVRGGIIDIFPPVSNTPVRLDLFDTDIDSIRTFDPVSQRSESTLDEVTLSPAREFFIGDDRREAGADAVEQAGALQVRRLQEQGLDDAAAALHQRVTTHVEKIRERVHFEGIDQYLPFFYDDAMTPLQYFTEGTLVLDDPVRIEQAYEATMHHIAETEAHLLETGRILPDQSRLHADWKHIFDVGSRRLYLTALDKRIEGMNPGHVVELTARTPESFHGRMNQLVQRLKERRAERYRVCLLVSTEERSERLTQALQDEGVEALQVPHLNGQWAPGHIIVTTGSLETGIELPHGRLLVLTDEEIFGRAKHRRTAKKRDRSDKGFAHFSDLAEGDYVVHINHGIGKYVGVETLEIAGAHKDYLVVKYAGDDKLYVPTDQVDMLQRYYGAESGTPKLNKLGGNEWARVKKRVKESVQEMAEDLLKLYAARETVEGYAFGKDTLWQTEFEDAFPYEETYDQMRAIHEVKQDMERPRPMDRLLCGDVGYGKTEVAVRAAFKAVADSKQVAYLVPTTILAQQHGRTFEQRFEHYPVNVRVLSRFQSTAEQNDIIKGIKDGTVDIVIGTHRLLSKDIRFKDLGLVVVDEEQRFGVAQKERLKEIRQNVDVLTLSATPIPRTLHMSLAGVRDMSVIETPPEDRLPVRTYVVEFDELLIKEAILREIGRDGQVYFVYNEVQKIDRFAAYLSKLVPEATIAVAHGQMDEDRLERVMLDFLNGEYDVLLCSTIIETGMDISNVNTLIIHDADRLGLAQLYQLRGRVGRSNRVAYAYFTYRKDKVLSEDAEKRLQAIKDFSELGSGFKIAMRDLEIRGAGNLLGPEQHGFIAAVGFELYCRLLEQSVQELQGIQVVQPPEPVIELDIDAYIPDDYVPDSRQKIELYKKVLAVQDVEEAVDLADEMRDRFGEKPDAVTHLLAISRMKAIGRRLGLGGITSDKDDLIVKMLAGIVLPPTTAELTRKYRGRVIPMPRTHSIRVKGRGLPVKDRLALAEMVLIDLTALMQ